MAWSIILSIVLVNGLFGFLFKDLRKIIAEKNREIEREAKFYNPSYYWKGRKVVSLDQWFQIKENYTLEAALHYFPDDSPSFGLFLSESDICSYDLGKSADVRMAS